MSLLQKITPINTLEEKAAFFQDTKYNPQFLYEEEVPTTQLKKYGKPKKKFIELAEDIVERTFLNRSFSELLTLEGPKVSQDEVTQKIENFLEMHQLAHKYQVSWSRSYVARTTITTNKIKLRLPASFRKEGLLGMLYHEIGTHALRRENYEQQPWFKRKKEHNMSSYLRTEEGLAILHSLLPLTFKMVYKPALNYIANNYALHHSFAETYDYLKKYIPDPERRWRMVFRHKRGLTDTSQPGNFSKDIVYLEGTVKIWHWLMQNNCNLHHIYFGKCSYKDVEKVAKLNLHFMPKLPSFYTTNIEKYQQQIKEIGQFNQFDQVSVTL